MFLLAARLSLLLLKENSSYCVYLKRRCGPTATQKTVCLHNLHEHHYPTTLKVLSTGNNPQTSATLASFSTSTRLGLARSSLQLRASASITARKKLSSSRSVDNQRCDTDTGTNEIQPHSPAVSAAQVDLRDNHVGRRFCCPLYEA